MQTQSLPINWKLEKRCNFDLSLLFLVCFLYEARVCNNASVVDEYIVFCSNSVLCEPVIKSCTICWKMCESYLFIKIIFFSFMLDFEHGILTRGPWTELQGGQWNSNTNLKFVFTLCRCCVVNSNAVCTVHKTKTCQVQVHLEEHFVAWIFSMVWGTSHQKAMANYWSAMLGKSQPINAESDGYVLKRICYLL